MMITAAFKILPGLVPADRISSLIVTPNPGHSFGELGEFTLYYRAHENRLRDDVITADIVPHPVPKWHLDGEKLVIEGYFAGEQEHTLDLIVPGSEKKRTVVLAAFRIYSVKPDLHGLKPYRGNFHQHSTNSNCCHVKEDNPAHVAAESRRIGLDFTTISDHSYYDSVAEANAVYAGAKLDLALYPGEEVHPMQWSQHIVNFGGKRGIIKQLEADKDKFYREVEDIRKGLGLPENMDTFVIAACEWSFAKIREAGGLAILAHPHWYYDPLAGLMVSPAVTDELIRRGNFDAMEVISGFYYNISEYNNWQIARWYQTEAEGRHIPPLGVNDSHRCKGEKSEFEWYFTLVLARSLAFDDIKDAVMTCRCGAVEHFPGAPARIFTSLRFIKYFHFLLREYFPKHDAMCQEEGMAMESFRKNESGAAKRLATLNGQTDAWCREFMGKML